MELTLQDDVEAAEMTDVTVAVQSEEANTTRDQQQPQTAENTGCQLIIAHINTYSEFIYLFILYVGLWH